MSKFVISDTVRWKAVKFQHNLKEDMEVAKILLDCYDTIISGCLQWEEKKKRTQLPNSTSENGWKLLEDIMHIMKCNDRLEGCCSLTMWNDDVDKVEVKEENKEQEVRGQDQTWDQCKSKYSMQTASTIETKQRHTRDIKQRDYVDNHFVDISLAEGDDDDDDDDNGDNDDDNDDDWTPQEQETQDKQANAASVNPILIKRPKRKTDGQPRTPKAHKKRRKLTRTVEFLSIPNQTKIIECKRCLHRVDSVDDFKKHFASHTKTAALFGNKVHKVKDMKLEKIPLFANVLAPCPDCHELQAVIRLETHRFRNHFQRNCDVCGDLFTSFSGWTRHMKVHKAKETGVNPHVCNICGRTFSLMGLMTQHRKLHSSDRTHICEVCGKGFKLMYGLRKHLVIHSDKSLTCEFCGKTFRFNYNLKTHLRTHTHERPFQCSVCGKSYSHNSSLKVHAKSEHGIDMENQCGALKEVNDLSSETSINITGGSSSKQFGIEI